MPDPTLSPSIYQGLGWSPAADPTMAPPVPQPPDGPPPWGGLPPSIAHGMGWAPPDAPPMAPQLPPTPTTLPSSQGGSPGQQPAPGGRDYPVAPSEFGAGIKPPSPNAPAKPGTPPPAHPQSFGQGLANLQDREAGTEQATQRAIQAGVDAQKPMHAEQLAAVEANKQTLAANAAERSAESEQWNKIHATNDAKYDADQKAVESWKFNRNKYMDELGVGGKVRWGIGMVLAGIGQGMMRQGGTNPVVEMLQQNIHDANVAQYKERDALVERLGFDRQTGMDKAAYHATRIADIDKKDGLANAVLAKSFEEAAVKSADPMAQANGMKAAADARAVADDKRKSSLQLQDQHDHQQGQLAIAGGELALNRKRLDWDQNKEQQQLDINAAKLLAQKQGKLDEEQAKRAIYIPSPDGSGQLVVARKQDGTPVLAGSADIAAKDQNMVAAASSYNRLVGQMVRGIKDHGGESTWIKGDEWQKMMTDLQSATAELHDAYGITAFREPTVQFFEKMATAGVDPTSFVRNASAALEHSNQNLQAKVNERVSARGYDGPQFGWRDTTSAPAPTQTDEEKVLSDALVDPRRGFDKRPGKLATELGNFSARGQLGPNETIDTRLKQEGGIVPSVRQTMATWGSALQSPDLAIRRHYYQQLEKIAKDSESPETAAFAQQLLERAQQQQLSATPGAANAPEPTRGASGAPGSP